MRKSSQKVVALLVVLTFIVNMLGAFPTVYAATDFAVDTVIEAEKTVLGGVAEEVRDKSASGGKYITTSGARVDDPAKLPKPDVQINVNIPSDGNYAVWAKVIIEDDSKDSYHSKWDEEDWSISHPGAQSSGYVWLKLSEKQLKAGKHTFFWNTREPGAIYDSFFITSDASKLPKIDGGSASAANPSAKPSNKPTFSGKIQRFEAVEGSAMFEAEDVAISDLVSVVDSDSASGKKGVNMSVDDRNTPAIDAGAGVAFEFVAEKGGTYSIWVRMVCTNGGSDSAWISLNGKGYINSLLAATSTAADDYQWSKLISLPVTAGEVSSVRIIPRETGAIMDKFVVTNAVGYVPKGMGELPSGETMDVIPLPSGKYPMPTITPPPEHPRLMFRKSDIPTIKANWNCEENAAAVAEYNRLLAMNTDGNVKPASNGSTFDTTILGAIEAMAFDYAINGNEAMGKQAIIAIKNFMTGVNYTAADPTRASGQIIFVASEVYDWCYPLLTKEDKAWLVSYCEVFAADMEIGWPPSSQGAVCGHGGETQLMRDHLAFGIATYDEYPDIYNYVAGRYLSEFLPTRNFWASADTQHQGTSYAILRRACDLIGQWIIYRMTGDTVFVPEFGNADYQWIYGRRPDGELIREGDDYNEATQGETYWNVLSTPLFYSSAFYKDPYIKKEFLKENKGASAYHYSMHLMTPVTILLFNDPSVGTEPVGELPKTKYFASPLGQMIARTGWNDGINAPDAFAFMKIGEYWGSNHNHLDAGSFQLYYKGMLASESGWYDLYGTTHDLNYNKRTVAHNSLLIYDPDEKITYYGSESNDGGQRAPGNGTEPATYETWIESGEYKTGEMLAHEFGPDTINPEYSYISGDIQEAYSDKVSEVRRSMLFMPNDNPDFPAMFVVFDKITAKDASFKKTFLLHSQEEIKTNGNVAISTSTDNGHNGMLTNQTLLPKKANLEVIGGEGKEFWVDGKNYEPVSKAAPSFEDGWGRLEVSPSEANKTDYFLNVMYVNDADKTYDLQKAELIESDSFYGAKLLGKAAIFGKNKERVENSGSFTIPGSESDMKIAVAGIKEGTWAVSVGGNEIAREIASKDGGIIYFTGPAGEYTITYVDANANKTFIESEPVQLEGIDIRVGRSYIYTDVPATVIDDRTLVPMRAIFEAIGATLSYDDATATATAVYGSTEIKLTENDKTAYVNGKAIELDVPAMIMSDRFMVPIRFVSEAMGAEVTWDQFTGAVHIKPGRVPTGPIPQVEGYAKIEKSTCSEFSEDFYDTNSWDGLPDTLWSAQGDHWINYVFDKEYTLSGCELWFNANSGRVAVFDIWTSTDGENWTKIMDGKGDAKNPDTWEIFQFDKPVTTKYIRFYAHGSNISMWNGLKEIRFAEKK